MREADEAADRREKHRVASFCPRSVVVMSISARPPARAGAARGCRAPGGCAASVVSESAPPDRWSHRSCGRFCARRHDLLQREKFLRRTLVDAWILSRCCVVFLRLRLGWLLRHFRYLLFVKIIGHGITRKHTEGSVDHRRCWQGIESCASVPVPMLCNPNHVFGRPCSSVCFRG